MKNNIESIIQDFGIKVKEGRKRLKLTQKELGQKVGITHEWICKIEKGRANSISLNLIRKICSELEIEYSLSIMDTPISEQA